MSEVFVRLVRPSDEETIRRICCDTALYSQPIDPLFSDRQFVADALLWYYTRFERESLFIADVQGQAVGYLSGCLDTHRFELTFARRVLPRLFWRCTWKGHWFRRAFWQLAIAGKEAAGQWAHVRERVTAGYPAHCHINLDTRFRHAGTGSALLHAFLDYVWAHGVRGVHIITATDGGKGFFNRAGFTLLAKYPAPQLPKTDAREAWVMGCKQPDAGV